MPYCQAWDCQNKPEDHAGKNLHNCGLGWTIVTFKWNRNKKVCSDHFHPKCYEEDMMAKMLGGKPKVRLKAGAVPTIFSHKTYDTINMDGEMMPPQPSAASS